MFCSYLLLLPRATKPWSRQEWGGVRKAANRVLEEGKVREQSEENQFLRMTQKQRNEMRMFLRPVILMEGPAKRKTRTTLRFENNAICLF